MQNKVAIRSMSILIPLAHEMAALAPACARMQPGAVQPTISTIPPPRDMPARDLRRMSRLTRFALFAADTVCRDSGVCGDPSCGLVVGLTHATTSFLQEFHDYLFDYGPQMVSPAAFSNGVTNAALGAISKHCNLIAGGFTLVGPENCGMEILHQATYGICRGDYQKCCVGASEEYAQLIADAYARLGWFCGGTPPYLPAPDSHAGFGQSEGSCFAVLANKPASRENAVWFTPLDNIGDVEGNIDLVISGAGGGPQDRFELEALRAVASRCAAPLPVIFPKCFFGETFSVSAMLSAAVAWDILAHKTQYPQYPAHESSGFRSAGTLDFLQIKTILVISGGRNGTVLAGLFSH